jgi:hypothetical protein
MKEITQITSSMEESEKNNAINNNFSALSAGITEREIELKDLDLLNFQGSIFAESASQDYAKLPLNGALIWQLSSNVSCGFLGETYHSGDYIVKLGNDKPFKIKARKGGYYYPTISGNTITYQYYENNENNSSGAPASSYNLTINSGADGSAAIFCSVAIPQKAANETYTFSNEKLGENFPIIEFFIENKKVEIDYSLSNVGTSWTISFENGTPACQMIVR